MEREMKMDRLRAEQMERLRADAVALVSRTSSSCLEHPAMLMATAAFSIQSIIKHNHILDMVNLRKTQKYIFTFLFLTPSLFLLWWQLTKVTCLISQLRWIFIYITCIKAIFLCYVFRVFKEKLSGVLLVIYFSSDCLH